jgi:hypothetical protein
MSNPFRQVVEHPTESLLSAAARLGVPTFVLVVLLTTIIPKIEHGIAIADRVDAELQLIAASCYAQRPVER